MRGAGGDVEVKRQKFYPRYRRKTEKGTRTTLAKPEGNLDHVLVALRKELRAELRWNDLEMRRAGFHTVIPMGERGLYVVALTEEDAELAKEFSQLLAARRFLERGTLRDTDEDVE
ncbi:MAG: hypothetical protein LC624_04370 [Halobacteriales archaeon]|nr:hypothetical protein [Halobacteriales archaeon]